MVNFWDLPRPVRDRIYRLRLVNDTPITPAIHKKICKNNNPRWSDKIMPPLLRVSDRTDEEAAPIYYSENIFELDSLRIDHVYMHSLPRHQYLIRRVTCDWDPDRNSSYFGFVYATQLNLHELNVRVDEAEMIRKSLLTRDRVVRQRRPQGEGFSPQEQLAMLRFPGMNGLLSLSGIPTVNFLKRLDKHKNACGGPLPDGLLLTHVLPKITAPKPAPEEKAKSKAAKSKGRKKKKVRKAEPAYFPLFDLPPELRNRIYDSVLKVPGPVHPTNRKPTSALQSVMNFNDFPKKVESALSLLAVNRQIHDEAVGIFYHHTPFVFHYPIQFHAFVASLGQQRRSFLRDVTIHYYNRREGGVSPADLAFQLLKQLPVLQKLQIIMPGTLKSTLRHRGFWVPTSFSMENANPSQIPAISRLFELRGVEDIKIRDVDLEEAYKQLEKDPKFPEFGANTLDANVVKLTKVLEHFNAALVDAQKGKVNRALLEDNKWQTLDEFPVLESQEENEDEDDTDGGEESGDEEEEDVEMETDEEETEDESDYEEEDDPKDKTYRGARVVAPKRTGLRR